MALFKYSNSFGGSNYLVFLDLLSKSLAGWLVGWSCLLGWLVGGLDLSESFVVSLFEEVCWSSRLFEEKVSLISSQEI